MSKEYKSLLDLFTPPPNQGSMEWYGTKSIACAFSADAVFLNEALTVFSKHLPEQRQSTGTKFMTLALNYDKPQLPNVPGLHQVFVLKEKSSRLLHAKVAVLRFQAGDAWLLRLVVCTGNWTAGTLKDTLDLFWYTEITKDDLTDYLNHQSADDVKQRIADFVSVFGFFKKLSSDYPMLAPTENSSLACDGDSSLYKVFPADLWNLKSPAKIRSRFIDSLDDSLHNKIIKEVKVAIQVGANNTVRGANRVGKANVLLFGSGFYEDPSSDSLPKTIKDFIDELQGCDGFLKRQSKYCDIRLYVNEATCGAIATCKDEIERNGWKIEGVSDPLKDHDRQLHAKFICAGNWRDKWKDFESAWLYLGSGNLTLNGFRFNENIEAGVFLYPLRFPVDKHNDSCISKCLPISFPKCSPCRRELLTIGEREDDSSRPTARYIACPIALFRVRIEGNRRWLIPEYLPNRDIESSTFIINGKSVRGNFRLLLTDKIPEMVEVRWSTDAGPSSQWIPVETEFGLYVGFGPKKDMSDFCEFLKRYRKDEVPPYDPPDPPDEMNSSENSEAHLPEIENTAVREIMQMIYKVGDTQRQVSDEKWKSYCMMLRAHFLLYKNHPAVKFFIDKMKVNPLLNLTEAPFLPDWIKEPTLQYERQAFNELIGECSREWRVKKNAIAGE